MASVKVIIRIAEGNYSRAINGLGEREIESWKSEAEIAAALREIADEFDKGMTFQVFTSAESLLEMED